MAVALDTNVVSELAKANCDDSVDRWIRQFRSSDIVLPAPCWAELCRRVNLLPSGRRRDVLSRNLRTLVRGMGGILPFDQAAAEHYAELNSEPGRPRPTFDALIAAVCLANSIPLATRNIADFEGCGIELIDPWQSQCQ